MLVVRNDDVPGMIAVVTGELGEAGINIDDMHLGRSAAGRPPSWCWPPTCGSPTTSRPTSGPSPASSPSPRFVASGAGARLAPRLRCARRDGGSRRGRDRLGALAADRLRPAGALGRRKRWDFWCLTGPGVRLQRHLRRRRLPRAWSTCGSTTSQRRPTASKTAPVRSGAAWPWRRAPARRRSRAPGQPVRARSSTSPTAPSSSSRLRHGARARSRPDVVVGAPRGPRVAHRRDPLVRPPLPVHDEGRRPARRPAASAGAIARYPLLGDGTSWGCLDFGRGTLALPHDAGTGAPAAGLVGGRTIGLQLGGKWTDGTGHDGERRSSSTAACRSSPRSSCGSTTRRTGSARGASARPLSDRVALDVHPGVYDKRRPPRRRHRVEHASTSASAPASGRIVHRRRRGRSRSPACSAGPRKPPGAGERLALGGAEAVGLGAAARRGSSGRASVRS